MGFSQPTGHREGLTKTRVTWISSRDSPGSMEGLFGNTVQVSSSCCHKRLAQKWLFEPQTALGRCQEENTNHKERIPNSLLFSGLAQH